MSWSEIALICVGAVLLVVIIAWVVTAKKPKNSDKKVDDFEVIDGVRYTKDDQVVDEKGEVKMTLRKGDIMLERGKVYKVGKDLLAGKYTVLSGDENISSINIRVGGLVRDYKHFSSIMLTDGDEISALSANVILR